MLVDEDGLLAKPQLSRLFRNVVEYPLAQLTLVGRRVQTFCIPAQLYAVYGTCHEILAVGLLPNCCISFATVAARPRSSFPSSLYQSRRAPSITLGEGALTSACTGVISR